LGALLVLRIIICTVLSCALLWACSSAVKQETFVEFALSTPDHLTDWAQLRTKLQSAGIECADNGSDLGTSSCSVAANSFDRAKEVAVGLITSNSLTVRVKKQRDSGFFDIYQQGKKVAEETYSPH
jgi:hypothetical protein